MKNSCKVYSILSPVFSVVEKTYESLGRGNGKWMEFDIELDRNCYDDFGNDTGVSIGFTVRYRSDASYVEVQWRIHHLHKECKPTSEFSSDWRCAAHHDSAWRGCWENSLLDFCRKHLIEEFDKTGNDSFYFHCGNVEVY